MASETIRLDMALRIWCGSPWNWVGLGFLLLAVARTRDPEACIAALLVAWQAAFLAASLGLISYCERAAMESRSIPFAQFLSQLRLRAAVPTLPALAATVLLLLVPRKQPLAGTAWRRRWAIAVLGATAATLLFVVTLITYILTGRLLG